MPKTRGIYFLRLIGRFLVLILALLLYVFHRDEFNIAEGANFLREFSPMLTVNDFFSWSLIGFAFLIWLIWRICVFTYPERFWENSNMALKCSECTDKLCTQYFRKLMK